MGTVSGIEMPVKKGSVCRVCGSLTAAVAEHEALVLLLEALDALEICLEEDRQTFSSEHAADKSAHKLKLWFTR